MSIKPVEDFGNDHAYWDLLRSVNPHLPKAEFVTTEQVTLRSGPEQMATLTFTTYITLPDLDKIYVVLDIDEHDTARDNLSRLEGDQ